MTENEWDDFAADWDTNEDVRLYSASAFDLWVKKVAPLASNLPQSRVLDFGCGTGLLSEKIARHCRQVVAIDSSPKMINTLHKKIASSGTDNIVALNIDINAETIATNPHFASKFDIIVASSVCSFLPDYGATLRNLTMLMKPGAYFVQWDWLEDMPDTKVRDAFQTAGLIEHTIEQAFSIDGDEDAMPVIMGFGQLKP